MVNRLLIVTDTNQNHITGGISRTINETIKNLPDSITSYVIDASMFPGIMLDWGLCLCYANQDKLSEIIEKFQPDSIHISTEGPVGIAVRIYCVKNNLKFTTAYHSMWPEYGSVRYKIPEKLTYKWVKWFHEASSKVMVAHLRLQKKLELYGFKNNFAIWSRGVNIGEFSPSLRSSGPMDNYLLYVGRVVKEKNIEAFLDLPTKENKVIVGDGPYLQHLKTKYTDVVFVGNKSGVELAKWYANAKVLVFPSVTDTFGIVILEALASGIPVAALPADNTKDILTPEIGCIDEDLARAISIASTKDGQNCRKYAMNFSWKITTQQFIDNLMEV